jgi:hypothetical protein
MNGLNDLWITKIQEWVDIGKPRHNLVIYSTFGSGYWMLDAG